MKKILLYSSFVLFLNFSVLAHCQIPCGIFDDKAQFNLLNEHIITIEKSISELDKDPDNNQAVRWILNKEYHATEISEIITYYFMSQRLKPSSDDYEIKLKILHEILVTSMKIKQNTDLDLCDEIRSSINEFENIYFSTKD